MHFMAAAHPAEWVRSPSLLLSGRLTNNGAFFFFFFFSAFDFSGFLAGL